MTSISKNPSKAFRLANQVHTPDKSVILKKPLANRLLLAIGLFEIVLACVGFWRCRGAYLVFVNNCDLLYLLALYRDVVGHQYSLSGWKLTPAPYFFPDMPVFFAAAGIMHNAAATYRLYGALMLVATFSCFYTMGRLILNSAAAARVAAFGFVVLLVCVLCQNANGTYWLSWKWLLAPTGHGAGMVAGLVCILLGMRLMQKPSFAGFVIFWLISALTIPSDGLVLAHYLLPVVAAGFYYVLLRRVRLWIPVTLAALLVLAKLSAVGIMKGVEHAGVTVPAVVHIADRVELSRSWKRMAPNLQQLADLRCPATLLLALSIIAAGLLLFILRGRPASARGEAAARFKFHFGLLLVIALFSLIAAGALPIVFAPGWINFDSVRYMQPFVIMPLLVLSVCIAWALEQMPGRGGTIAVGAAAVGLMIAWVPCVRLPAVHDKDIFYNADVRLLDRAARKYSLHCGCASYWHAKLLTLNSKTGVRVNALEFDGTNPRPDWWIDNANHWSHAPRSEGDGIPQYDFVFCLTRNRPQFERYLGPPAAVMADRDSLVLVYNRKTDVLLGNLARAVRQQQDDAHLP